jgi:DNA-binding NtrC family response regulator
VSAAAADLEAALGHLAAGLAELTAWRQRVGALGEMVGALREGSRDPRLSVLGAGLAELAEGLDSTIGELEERRLPAALAATGKLCAEVADGRLSGIVQGVLTEVEPGADALLQRLLDGAIAATGAERGYVLLAHPTSTEADVACARNYATTNLSLDEYRFSRTLVRRALEAAEPVLLANASEEPGLAQRGSVRRFGLRSVLVAPLLRRGVPLGVLYLEDTSHPQRFVAADRELLVALARLAVSLLGHAGLLPRPPASIDRVFLDAGRVGRELVGRDPQMLEVLRLVRQIADAPATVLLLGETGTGKDLVARALHYQSARHDGPFVAINCAAIPRELVESELFGHEKGAFTGAAERHLGRVEQAHGGTLFLDEIDHLPPELQAKLLHFLQSSEISRLGGGDTIRVDARVVAATSRNLRHLAEEGRFLDALFYRLHVVPITLPPLRQRRGDIPLLVEHFLDKLAALYQRRCRLAPEVLARLAAHDYPGNVRELENLVHRLVALATGPTIDLADLPPELAGDRGEAAAGGAFGLPESGASVGGAGDSAASTREELRRLRAETEARLEQQEAALARRVVAAHGGNVTAAARDLGMHRVTLHRILGRRQ